MHQLHFLAAPEERSGPPGLGEPLAVAYGLGVDSTAMLVQFQRLGLRPDLILTADTGGEKPETYAYLPVMQAWLASVGFPPVVVVQRAKSKKGYTTLEGNCLINQTLPSLAFGRKSCSLKWKREPQEKYTNHFPPALAAWAAGQRVVKAIGYDAGPKDARRGKKLKPDKKYRYWYPLREWGWDRERCAAEIGAAGLPLPPKSSCFFCPAMQPAEVAELTAQHPDLAERICAMEAGAQPKLLKIKGLWGRGTKTKPGAMTTFIRSCQGA